MAGKIYKGKPLNDYSKLELVQICEELMATVNRLSVDAAEEEM